MTTKILFVDDEKSLLNGIERRLGRDFDLATAISGDEALRRIEQDGPFAVVVTDMRMPGVDGVELVQRARGVAPDTIYMMLTGNQDQATAIDAVNKGQVFRFLNKPCSNEDLKTALLAGLRQYQLVAGERDLLHKTFCGAVGVLTDVLEIAHHEVFGRTARVSEIVSQLCGKLDVAERWEYKLAAKLSLIGFAITPEMERVSIDYAVQFEPDANRQFVRAANVGMRLIQRIPRLDVVAQIIGRQAEVDGRIRSLQPVDAPDVVELGATLIRLALYWDYAACQGLDPKSAVRDIRTGLPQLPPQFTDALCKLKRETNGCQRRSLAPRELKDGMVLADDILTSNSMILLRKGRRLSTAIIEKIRCHAETLGDDLLVNVYTPGEVEHAAAV